MQETARNKMFGGWQIAYTHTSSQLHCDMAFSVYLPPQADMLSEGETLPALYWLSGLTCTDQNFATKACAQKTAARLGMILIMPDTSPRGDDIPDDDSYDLGQGAGFYVDATQTPWNTHFNMYSYIVDELPALVNAHFKIDPNRIGIAGHSMGGHGALMIALKNPSVFTSASAFAPISHPSQCPWGEKAFTAYLGNNQDIWKNYDTVHLLNKNQQPVPMLVDQGLDDTFLAEQLKPDMLEAAAIAKSYPLIMRQHQGYDHSYYFIASFIDEHLEFHYKHCHD